MMGFRKLINIKYLNNLFEVTFDKIDLLDEIFELDDNGYRYDKTSLILFKTYDK